MHLLGDRYRLEQRVGAGGMGEVWRAVDEILGRVVAVKVLPADGDSQRFLAEAKAMAGVRHPNVAAVHDYGRSGGVTYLVMEFVDGESLAGRLARTGRLAPADAMTVVAHAADGLQAVHARGTVHRDVKPANLMIRPDGTVVVTDFGIARAEDAASLTATGAVLGTPAYVSPEQVLGHPATPLSDVYSLGLTAYECLTGRKPFTGDNPYAIALQRVQGGPPALGPEIAGPVRAVLDRALAADPRDRFPSAAAMAEAARSAAAASPPLPPPPSRFTTPAVVPPPRTAAPAAKPPRSGPSRAVVVRRTRIAAAAGAVLAVAIAAGILRLGLGDGAADAAPTPPPESGVTTDPTSTTDETIRRAGFVSCGVTMYCPREPMCWAGTTEIGGRAQPLRRLDCARDHWWETFVVLPLPPDKAGPDTTGLADRPEVAGTCSVTELVLRSRDDTTTTGWQRHAWPIRIEGTDVWLVHCLATPPKGGTRTGAAFKPAT